MADTTSKRATAAKSARVGEDKDFITRLADAGEEAFHRLTELPGGQRAVNAMNDLRARVDDLAKKVRGIDALGERVAKLERDVAALKKERSSSKASSSRKPPASS